MIKFKSISLKNFQSVGNVTQTVNLTTDGMTLILGVNADQDESFRNGTGKSTLTQAICFALYGNAITNVKKDNLVNKINNKNMIVSLEFEVNGKNYRIERGRKPAILRFYIDNNEFIDNNENEANGENKHTQEEIDKILSISYKLYRQIISVSSNTTPFLSLKDGEQREIIEELLGITLLSKKSEVLSNLIKQTKDSIKEEEIRLKTISESNNKIKSHIDELKFKSKNWDKRYETQKEKLLNDINVFSKIDIEQEIKNHEVYNKIKDINHSIKSTSTDISILDKNINILNKSISNNKIKLTQIDNNICPECEQEIHNNKTDEIKNCLITDIANDEETVNQLKDALEVNINSLNNFNDEKQSYGEINLIYKTLSEAYNHQRVLDSLEMELKNHLSQNNPFDDQIGNLNESGIQEVNYDYLNEQITLKEHQEFLLKLLTKKDSFIRKKIIDQNLSFLNNRLNSYLTEMNFTHTVMFNSDLTVDITLHGKDYDFEQLSSGEKNRLILSLSWSFRDIWETFNQSINIFIIDELVDTGMDKQGVSKSLDILRKFIIERNKNIFLISHKGEIENKVDNTLFAIKENDFTSYQLSS